MKTTQGNPCGAVFELCCHQLVTKRKIISPMNIQYRMVRTFPGSLTKPIISAATNKTATNKTMAKPIAHLHSVDAAYPATLNSPKSQHSRLHDICQVAAE